MNPRIETLSKKKLVGLRMSMSLTNYRIAELWKKFGPMRASIQNQVSSEMYSLAIYPEDYFVHFNPQEEFERWALVEVSSFENLGEGLETLEFPGGLYAIFHYKGLSTDRAIFEYIYSKWLPNSNYELANRPHVEVLGANYKNNHPDSEEAIWIPLRAKNKK